MKVRIFFCSFVVVCLLSAVCIHLRSSVAANRSFPALKSSDVAYIVVGDGQSEATISYTNSVGDVVQVFPFNEFFRITDRREIDRLTKQLNSLSGRKDGRLTLSGILSMQAYVSTEGDVLALASIISAYSTVLVSKNVFIHEGRLLFHKKPSELWASGSCPTYCRDVLSLMRKRSPNEVAWRESECVQMGKTLEEYMGLSRKKE